MKIYTKSLALVVVLLFSQIAVAQTITIKNDIVYDAFRTPNLSAEVRLGKQITLDAKVGANFLLYANEATKSNYTTKKFSHWMVQPELRYWTCEVFNRWFFGVHLMGGQMNVGSMDIPFVVQNKNHVMKDNRYEGYFYGGGLSVGYQFYLTRRLNLELALGAGYARIRYDKYPAECCGRKFDEGWADYIGPTKAALSLVYFLK